jgi:hypothetical protein
MTSQRPQGEAMAVRLSKVATAALVVRYKLDRPYGAFLLLGAIFDPYLYAAIVYFVLHTVFLLADEERYYLLLIGFISFRWVLSSISASSNFSEILARFSEVTRRPACAAIIAIMAPPTFVFLLSVVSALIFVGVLQPLSQSFAALGWLPFVALIQGIWTVLLILLLSRLRVLGFLKHEMPIAVVASLLWITSPAMYTFGDIPAGASKFLTSYNPVSHLLAAFHNAYWFGLNISLEILPVAGVIGLAMIFVVWPRIRKLAPENENPTADPVSRLSSDTGWVHVVAGAGEFDAPRPNAAYGVFRRWRDRTVDFTGRDLTRLVTAVWRVRDFAATEADIQKQSQIDRLFRDFLSVYPDRALDQLAAAAALASPEKDIVFDGLLNRVSPAFLEALWPILGREAQTGRRITIVRDDGLIRSSVFDDDPFFVWEDETDQPDQSSGEAGLQNAGKAIERPIVLVTGGASQVGRCVLARISERGQPAIALQHRQPVPSLEHVAVAHGDLSGDQLPRLDAVQMVHISAIWMLPENLPWLAHCGLRRLVCFSSTSILSKAESSSPYERAFAVQLGDSENQVLAACEKLGIDCVILRPTMIYGLGIDRNISRAARFIERFGFYPVAMRADGLRQPVHADDLAAACLSVLDSVAPLHGVYEVGGGETLPYDEMIGRVFDVLGRPRRFLRIPMLAFCAAALGWVSRRPEITGAMVSRMGEDLIADNTKAAADFGHEGRKFLTGELADIRPQNGTSARGR